MFLADIAKLSGLSEAQINQAISRWSIPVWGRGKPRSFLPADAFAFAIAGQLHRLGLDWPAIRDGLNALQFEEMDRSTGLPVDIYRGPKRRGSTFYVFFPSKDGYVSQLVPADGLPRALSAYGENSAIVIDARSIAERIEAHAKKMRKAI